jgi:large subunit ribosomal protein L3
MLSFIIGKKIGMSQKFDAEGRRMPVTMIKTDGCYVIDITKQENGNIRVTLGYGSAKKVNKPTQGKLDKAGIKTPLRFFKEVSFLDAEAEIVEAEGKKQLKKGETIISVGDAITPATLFKEGDKIDVAGITKGKGFQGVVKRHNFRGGPRTHGQSDRERAPGSLGQTTTPGRVYKGKRMAGRMGSDRVTVKNLKVISVSEEGMTITGLVPGVVNRFVEVKLTTQQ